MDVGWREVVSSLLRFLSIPCKFKYPHTARPEAVFQRAGHPHITGANPRVGRCTEVKSRDVERRISGRN